MNEPRQSADQRDSTPRSKRPFYLLWLVAVGSLGSAYLLFYLAVSSGLWGTTNHGSFVQPAITATDLDLRHGRAAQTMPFQNGGSWWLWFVTGQDCAAQCEADLAALRAAHLLLNRNALRVQRALVTLVPVSGAPVDEALVHLWSAGVGRLPVGIYIVDPNGNLVLHYPPGPKPEHVLEDIKKLLKVSQIG
jgi:cytochrome oxidase Cu insertion factor (SCO1/SenC/PrrC family)